MLPRLRVGLYISNAPVKKSPSRKCVQLPGFEMIPGVIRLTRLAITEGRCALFCGLEAETVRWWLAARWSYFGGQISICHPTTPHLCPELRPRSMLSLRDESAEAACETEGSVCVGKKRESCHESVCILV